jgi:hypothetical protein
MGAIRTLPPAFWMAVVLVASVAAFRMWRGHPCDEAIGDGVLWLCGVVWVGAA